MDIFQILLPAAPFHKKNMVSVLKRHTKGTYARPRPMTATELKRHKILSLLEFGITPAAICAKMGFSPNLVRRVDMLRKAGKSLAPNYKGGTRSKRTADFMREIGKMFEEKPRQNYGTTAKELGVSAATVRRSAKELGYKSYQHRYRAILSTKAKVKRLERSEDLLDWLAHNKDTIMIFSDEKMWDVDSHKNRRNHRYIAKCKDDVPPKWCSKNPQSAMMLG